MRTVRIAPSRIFGACPAGHRLGDEQVIEGLHLRAVRGPLCYVATGALTAQVGQVQAGSRISSHVSCPGCGSTLDHDARVVFVLGCDELWDVAYKLSQYNWYRLEGCETEESRALFRKSWELANQGEGKDAERLIDHALAVIESLPCAPIPGTGYAGPGALGPGASGPGP